MSIMRQLEHDLRVAAERQLQGRSAGDRSPDASTRRRRPPTAALVAPGIAIAIVVLVGALFIGLPRRRGSGAGPGAAAGAHRVVFAVSAGQAGSVGAGEIERAAAILRARLAATIPGSQVSRTGNRITVALPSGSASLRARVIALAAPGRLDFYDWEGDVLAPDGRTVAQLLQQHSPTGIRISQGDATMTPGQAESLSLISAVRLAARQPAQAATDGSRHGPQYFMLATTASPACQGAELIVLQRCVAAGPASTLDALVAELPAGVSLTQGEVVTIPQGITILKAMSPSNAPQAGLTGPPGASFVLRDRAALTGAALTNVEASKDPVTGQFAVSFGFTANGAARFRALTGVLARRGELDSGLGEQLDQHFAVALDDQLLEVASIDFRQYPDGISGGHGADLIAGFTAQSARDLAAILRTGPLPVLLTPVG